MSLLDDYANRGEEETEVSADPNAARRKRADLERQLLILDSDLKKLLREKTDLEVEQRRLKKQEERIQVDRFALEEKLHLKGNDLSILEEEIRVVRKKLKTLH